MELNYFLDITKVDLPMINELLSYIPLENIDKDIIASNIFYILNQEEDKVDKEYVTNKRQDIREQIKQIEYEQLKEIVFKIVKILPFKNLNGYNWGVIICEDAVINICYEIIQNDFKFSPEMCINMVTNMMNQSKNYTQNLSKLLQNSQ